VGAIFNWCRGRPEQTATYPYVRVKSR
jgi:hypothetical protein